MLQFKFKYLIIILIVILVIYYFFNSIAMYMNVTDYIYFPNEQDFNNCPGFSDSEKKEHQGTRFYYTENSDKLLIFYHGNAGSACDRAFIKDQFKQMGYSTIFVEYAGFSNLAHCFIK